VFACQTLASRSGLRAVGEHSRASAASALTIARPSPWLAPVTKAASVHLQIHSPFSVDAASQRRSQDAIRCATTSGACAPSASSRRDHAGGRRGDGSTGYLLPGACTGLTVPSRPPPGRRGYAPGSRPSGPGRA
jgi:hypothetical protein